MTFPDKLKNKNKIDFGVMKQLQIVVIGMGYVGIPTAAVLADIDGYNVIGIQRNSDRSGWKIDCLNSGKCPIEGKEPGLAELIEKVVKKGTFKVSNDMSLLKNADVILIDVQTPVDECKKPQYSSLLEVSLSVGKSLKKGSMVIVESTVAPGTTNYIIKPLLEEASGLEAGVDFNLVFSYERVMVGRLLYNLKYLPRIVGGFSPACTERGVEFYKNICFADLYPTDSLTAEVAKVTENTYRDVNIAFANEVALICESLGVNVHDVRRFVNSLPNIPSDQSKNPFRMMHKPGAGVGGHCLPKDPWLLKFSTEKYGKFKFNPKILVESRKINDFMPFHIKELIESALSEKGMELSDSRICILGFAFIADSDDTRNTPTLPLYNYLKDVCKDVVIHDPFVKNVKAYPVIDNLESALRDKNCLVIITDHKDYSKISLEWLKNFLATPIIVDGRNVFNPKECERTGFIYKGIGIGKKENIQQKETS